MLVTVLFPPIVHCKRSVCNYTVGRPLPRPPRSSPSGATIPGTTVQSNSLRILRPSGNFRKALPYWFVSQSTIQTVQLTYLTVPNGAIVFFNPANAMSYCHGTDVLTPCHDYCSWTEETTTRGNVASSEPPWMTLKI